MVSLASLRVEVEERLKGRVSAPFNFRPAAQTSVLNTGIPAIDSCCGGIPLGAITELVTGRWCSAGTKSLFCQVLARVTAEQFGALVDATDSFDPRSAKDAGVRLDRLLWVRCSGKGIKAVEQAFTSADLLLQGSGGFGLLVVDLANVSPEHIRKVPSSTWFRFRSVVEKLHLPLLISTSHKVVGSCSALTLSLLNADVRWSEAAAVSPTHGRLPVEIDFKIEAEPRRSLKKPAIGVQSFRAERRWA